jgi:hypothetical protein
MRMQIIFLRQLRSWEGGMWLFIDLMVCYIDKWGDGCLSTINLLQVVVPSWLPSVFLSFMAQLSTCCRLLWQAESPVLSSEHSWHNHQPVAGCWALLRAQRFPLIFHGTTINLLQVVVPRWVPSAFLWTFMTQPPTCCRLLCHAKYPLLSS